MPPDRTGGQAPIAPRGRAALGRSRRSLRLVAGAAVVVIALIAVVATAVIHGAVPATAQVCAPNSPEAGTQVGECAPNFTLDDPAGRSVSLAQFLGHPVMIHFWAVGCTTCAAGYPDFSRIVRSYTPKGLTVLAVDAWGEPSTMIQTWQNSHHLPATLLVDQPQAVVNRFGVQGTPTTFFVDRTGHIVATSPGPLSYSGYRDRIAKIL